MESERSAASLAMQSHHILFWSCRHWGSPLSPLLTIRTCHWISFKKKRKKKGKPPIFPYSLRPYLSAFSLLLIFFFSLFSYITCLRCCHHPFFLLFRSQDLVVAIFLPVTVIFPKMKLKTTKSKVTRFLQTFVVTPLFLLPPFLFFVLQLSHLTTSLWISFLILNMQMI